jgi:hypothetical protein
MYFFQSFFFGQPKKGIKLLTVGSIFQTSAGKKKKKGVGLK